MALLAVQEQGYTSVTAKGGALVVRRGAKEIISRPVHEVHELQLYGAVELTAAARWLVLDRRIDTIFLTRYGQYRGRLVGRDTSNGQRRAAQYQFLLDSSLALELAKQLVRSKLKNQRFLLQRVRRDHPDRASPRSLVALRSLIRRVDEVQNLDVLRGVEGFGAVMYFRGLSKAFANPSFAFVHRNRRPPRDPINACLSFGYTILLTRVESAVWAAGLDPYLGALHEAGRGKPALALDLMEELRPVVVDRTVLRLINRRQLNPADFVNPEGELSQIADPEQEDEKDQSVAVHLGPVGRPILLRELGRTWRSRHVDPVRQVKHTLRAIADHQPQQLGALFEGRRSMYEPFRWR
ncbi:MAG: CRISPR-associated endonuclease Cas1 [Proteobacteria bacterium]|nr:CRISPR-associated endonuclease Cas1 [Pseudomonadota bacterium]